MSTTPDNLNHGTALAGRTVLITGAGRGFGTALVDEALARGAARVYATARTNLNHADNRVVPLRLDITRADQIRAVADKVPQLDILVNNAGLGLTADLTDSSALEELLKVNVFGSHAVSSALLPQLKESKGAVVNVLSLAALASVPFMPAYSVSKAAALSLTQGQRQLFGRDGISVYAVLAGPIDTDMSRELDIPKAAPADVAKAMFDGVERGDEEIFPDPWSGEVGLGWGGGLVKTLEKANAALAG